MADEENILGGKLSIEDNYSNALMRFANNVLGAENKFKQFADKVLGNNNRIGSSMTKTQKEVDKFAERFMKQGDSVADSINKANERVKQNQEKTIDGLTKKYLKLGMTIQDAYSKAQQESNRIWNGDSNPSGGNNSIKDFAENIISNGFGNIIGKVGLIGSILTGTNQLLKTIDNTMGTGFDTINKFTGNLFTEDGLKKAFSESLEFESGRKSLNVIYGSEEAGLKAYNTATSVAQKTPASETDMVTIMQKIGIAGATRTDEEGLLALADIASLKPELGYDHLGFAIQEAINGRISSLSMNYGINNEKLEEYLNTDLKKNNKSEYNRLKNAINKQGTANSKYAQEYVDLIISYAEREDSTYKGLANQYLNTINGKMQRFEGMWKMFTSDIMGIDTSKGEADAESAAGVIGDFMNGLMDRFDTGQFDEAKEGLKNGLFTGASSVTTAFDNILDTTNWEEVGKSLSESLNYFADTIDQLSTDGTLKTFFDDFGTFVKYYVQKQSIELERSAKDLEVASDDSNLVSKTFRYTGNWMEKVRNQIYNSLDPNGYTNSKNEASDSQMIEAIRRNKNLTFGETNELYKVIKSDDINKYEINIEKIEANNFDEIMESIKQAQANRR